MAVDLDRLRQRCRDLSDRELLRTVIADADQLHPEALPVWREELSRRLGDIQIFVDDCTTQYGEDKAQIPDVENFRDKGSSLALVGSFSLSTGGIAFVATSEDDHGAPVDAMLGPLLAPLYDRLFRAQVQSPSPDLPPPFLAAVYETVFWYPISRIERLQLQDGRVLTIQAADRELAWCVVRDCHGDLLRDWTTTSGVKLVETESASLWSRVRKLFGSR